MAFLSDQQRKAVFARLSCGRKVGNQVATKFYNGTPGKVGTHDRVELVNGKPTAYLYSTPIATLEDTNVVTRTDGFRTTTTKDRLNCLISPSGHTIFQKKGQWFHKDEEGHVSKFEEGQKFPLPSEVAIDHFSHEAPKRKSIFEGLNGKEKDKLRQAFKGGYDPTERKD